MPSGIGVNSPAMTREGMEGRSVPSMARKNEEDQELESRIRGHIRREMVERELGVNEMGRRLGLGGGTLSRILNEERGFGSGFVLRVLRKLTIPAKILLEEDPSPRFMAPGVPDVPER